MSLFQIFYFLFIFACLKDLTWNEFSLSIQLIWYGYTLENTKKNQIFIARLISELGIIPVKLAQWMAYFLKIQFEHDSKFQLVLNSLPYLQSNCHAKKPSDLTLKLGNFSSILQDYERDPFCAASIAQVYKGTLFSGKTVAIKVKHDNISKSIDRWEIILQSILKYINLNINLEEFFENIRHQIDFEREAENMKLYGKLYKKNQLIKIPEYYDGDKDVIIMEYVDSENFSKVKHSLTTEDVRYYTYLSRLLYEDNVFVKDVIHMDLHNGNWGIIQNTKQMVLYDFGWILRDQTDFKRFFILSHMGRYGSLEFFLKKYGLHDKDNKLQDYVNNICDDRSIDTLYGVRLVLKMFPNEVNMDNFMFCILSLSVFISSISDHMEDTETFIDSQIKFMEDHNVFLPLCSLMKNIRTPEMKEKLKQWHTQMDKAPSNEMDQNGEL